MTTVYLDIETIPSQEPWVAEYAAVTVKPPGTLKKAESIEKWMQEERAGAIQDSIDKMGFDGSTNHIICIGVAIDDRPTMSFDIKDISREADGMKMFYEYLPKGGATFVGHNISGFDLKIIRQRSVVLGVKPNANIPFTAKPWDLNPFDTMVQWDPKNFIKLDRLCRAFGIPGKEGMDGSKVYGAWKEGRMDEIAQYCRNDVDMTRAVYKKMVA